MLHAKNDAVATHERLRCRLAKISRLSSELAAALAKHRPPMPLLERLDGRLFQTLCELQNDIGDVVSSVQSRG